MWFVLTLCGWVDIMTIIIMSFLDGILTATDIQKIFLQEILKRIVTCMAMFIAC